ncbi:hypothetical protein N7508_004930 [Penicillium antarcticum]|uniref:uncharacterized protein n=1 Tax=Penicillium antarcticum TaxID=416450 RepID=UPI00238F46F7|nr:uncharacterized protein N7508_004930 [Penicillium antarcticum]KAJ5305915.1 hypothetical protein N7508_004930 [Penicillium antarcticum]
MSSHAEMNSTPDNDPDEVSSSVDSDQDEDKSYVVETIWAERVTGGLTEYLIKWEGYPAERATWEPVEMFDDEAATLKDWDDKKKLIESGHHEPFNIKSWEKHCAKLRRDRQSRRQRREIRISGEQSPGDLVDLRTQIPELHISSPTTQDTPSTPLVSQNHTTSSRKSRASQVSPNDRLPASHGYRTKPPSSDLAKATDRNKRRKLEKPQPPIERLHQSAPEPSIKPAMKPVIKTVIKSPIKPAPKPAPQLKPQYTPQPDIEYAYKYPHQWKHEPAPALTISTSTQSASTFGEGGTGARAGLRPLFRRDPAAEFTKLDMIRPSQFPERTGHPDTNAADLPVIIAPTYPPMPKKTRRSKPLPSPSPPPSPGYSAPRKQTFRDKFDMSKRQRRSLKDGDINKPADIFSRRDSPARRRSSSRSRSRSPGLLRIPKPPNTSAVLKNINTNFNPRSITPADFSLPEQLALMPTRTPEFDARTIPGYWFNPGEVLMMTSFGRDENLVGNTRACGLSLLSKDIVRNKPRGKAQLNIHFEHLCTTDEITRLRTRPTATNTLKPTVAMRTGWIEGFHQTNESLLHMAEHLRKNDLVAIFYSPMGSKIAWVASSRYPQNTEWINWIRNKYNENVPSGVPILLTACENLLPIASLGSRARSPTFAINEGGPKNTAPSLDPQLRTNTQSSQPFSANRRKPHSTTFRQLALEPDKSVFGVPTPDAVAEVEILKMMYAEQGIVTFTNQNPGHWALFVNENQQGVVIFHESFHDYESLQPPIARVNKKLFNFWVVRVLRPIDLPDHNLNAPSIYAQRILKPGTAMVLITQDAMSNLIDVAIILRWIFRCQRKRVSRWKIVFFPGILQWITDKLNDEGCVKDHNTLRLIESLIMRNNVDYPPTRAFDASSLDFFGCLENSTSTVVELPSVEDRTDRNKSILDEAERDADHLIEILAGVAKLKMARFGTFIAIVSERLKTSASKSRWENWGHIFLHYGFEGFHASHISDREFLLGEVNAARKAM